MSGRAVVGVVMGSDSDWPVMQAAAEALAEFDVPCEVDVVSAHRMPQEMIEYGRTAVDRGLRVIIAGAGGAAHLPGMLAAVTPLPVIGVPVPLAHLDGMDSLLSIVQMPAGVPVATVSVGGARNAGLLAVRILGAGGGSSSTARSAGFTSAAPGQSTTNGTAPDDVDVPDAATLRARMVAFQESLRDQALTKGERLRAKHRPTSGTPPQGIGFTV